MIVYDKFFQKLRETGTTQKKFSEDTGIYGSTLQAIRSARQINTSTLDQICSYFSCQPSEIIEWISEEEFLRRQAKLQENQISDIEKEIEVLQQKIEKLKGR